MKRDGDLAQHSTLIAYSFRFEVNDPLSFHVYPLKLGSTLLEMLTNLRSVQVLHMKLNREPRPLSVDWETIFALC